MATRTAFIFVALLLTLSACNLARERPATPETLPTSGTGGGKPVVTISSPEDGDEIVVNTDLLVTANATDNVGVTRVQLVANNQIVKTVSSESLAGDENMNVVLDYRPPQPGDLTLEVIAYRGAVASDPAVVEVTVRASESQVTATIVPQTDVPIIDPNDPTCRALTNVPLNVRTGPGTNFSVITTLATGTQVPIVGRLGDNSWWEVRTGGRTGWVIQRNPANPNEQFISIFGNCSLIPIVNPPVTQPPPPPPATFTHTPTRTATPLPSKTNTPRPADLIVVTINGPATVTIPGGESSVTENYSVTITNNGEANTGQFTNSIVIVNEGPAVELGTVGNLSAGESIALNTDITFTSTGSFVLRVNADSEDDVDEVSEVNNTGSIDVTIISE